MAGKARAFSGLAEGQRMGAATAAKLAPICVCVTKLSFLFISSELGFLGGGDDGRRGGTQKGRPENGLET